MFFTSVKKLRFFPLAFLLVFFVNFMFYASVFTSVFLVFVDDASVCVLVFALVRTLVFLVFYFVWH